MVKIKKDILDDVLKYIHKENFFELIEDFNSFSFDIFQNIFGDHLERFQNFKKSFKLLEYLSDYNSITNFNSELVSHYMDTLKSLISILHYNELIKERSILFKEMKISGLKKRSSDIAAKADLLDKLKQAISKDKKQLEYFKEDYNKLKNRVDQIKDTIINCNKEISDLNKSKKECFSQINKLTRSMDGPDKRENNKPISGQIRGLQQKAKECQYEINQVNLKRNESQSHLNDITPNYDKLEERYLKLVKGLQNDEKKALGVKKELEEVFNVEDNEIGEIHLEQFNFFKPVNEIENELAKVESELEIISKTEIHLNIEKPQDLSKISKKVEEIQGILKSHDKNLIIGNYEDELIENMDNYRAVEDLLANLESLQNIFLSQINLNCQFQINITENYENFFIQLSFVRGNREVLEFQSLTTPEKIFFLIIFYISIKIHINSKSIVFSNLFLPRRYDKRGSIFRTIRKIIPVFENNEFLKQYKLIFIISNLEMKKPIEKIKIVNLEEG